MGEGAASRTTMHVGLRILFHPPLCAIDIRSASRMTSSGAQGFDQNFAPSGKACRNGLPEVTITSSSGLYFLATCASSTPVM